MSKVIFFEDDYSKNIPKALQEFGLGRFKGKDVLIKLHMGELNNKWYVDPKIAKVVVDELKKIDAKPILFDTAVLYSGPRATKEGYMDVARKHGFTELGCPVVIGDEGKNIDIEGLKFEIAKEVLNYENMIVLSHGKGHGGAGFGGAIKNLGMGCVSGKCKRIVHSEISVPCPDEGLCTLCGTCEKLCKQGAIKVDKKWQMKVGLCVGCGECIKNCPQKALDYKEESLNHMLAYASKAATQHMKNILYVSVLQKITKQCDCANNSLPIICDDVGFVVSDDMISIDKASIDMIEKKMGKTFLQVNGVDPMDQIKTAEKIKIGTSKYAISKI